MKALEIIHFVQVWKMVPKCQDIPEYSGLENEYRCDRKIRLWKLLFSFLTSLGRIGDDTGAGEVIFHTMVKKVLEEDYSRVPVKVTLADISEELEIWIQYGKLTRMAIFKPERRENFNNLLYWKLCMIFDHHQAEVIEIPVALALRQFDHVIAWYALWRCWPVYYQIWEWVGNLPDVGNIEVLQELGNSQEYKEKWQCVHNQIGSMYPLVDNRVDWSRNHVCCWQEDAVAKGIRVYWPKVTKDEK